MMMCVDIGAWILVRHFRHADLGESEAMIFYVLLFSNSIFAGIESTIPSNPLFIAT